MPCVQVPYTKVLRFINRLAGAIHRAVPGAKVTVGAHSMPYTTDLPMPALWYDNAPMNYYSDNLLVSVQLAPCSAVSRTWPRPSPAQAKPHFLSFSCVRPAINLQARTLQAGHKGWGCSQHCSRRPL